MFKNKIFTVAILLLSFLSNAQIVEKEYGTFELAFNQLTSTPITVFDNEAGLPNQIDEEVYSYLSLSINNNEAPFVWYELKAIFDITPLKSDGSEDTANSISGKEIVVNYNPNSSASGSGTEFSDLNLLKVQNRYGLKFKLVSFTALNLVNGSTVLPSNAYVKAGFRAKRFYTVSQQQINPTATPIAYSSGTSNGHAELEINWSSLAGAIEYELEWTWVDGYHSTNLGAMLAPSQIVFSDRDFELNNTRIITRNLKYKIPLIYSKGYLIYRVRGISRFSTSSLRNFYGVWSSGSQAKNLVSNWPHVYTISQDHEVGKNWQFQASYAEEGKKKEVVSYFDGSLRNRQTVTKVNTDNNAVIGEVIYDVQGRPAIEILPTPIKEEHIQYYDNVNLNSNGQPYTHKDFDWEVDDPLVSDCGVAADEMSQTSGSSEYYSPNNDFLDRKNHNYIPNAEGYPFSQVEYTNDNTGRIAKKSGVGETHQIGKGHEMEYLYTTPTNQKELNRLFGYSVGDVSHYKKNYVKDPNGQVSVSYIDPQGRTIATALVGDSPAALEGLNDENLLPDPSDPYKPVHQETLEDILVNNNLTSTNNFGLLKDKLVLTKQIVSPSDFNHIFDYSMTSNGNFTTTDCGTATYPFSYDLKISLIDNCGNDLLNPTINEQNINSATKQSNALLKLGSYNLVKNLSINATKLNEFADDFVTKLTSPGSPCYVDPTGFAPNVDFSSCNYNCITCRDAFSTKDIYIEKSLNEFYNLASLTNWSITINATGITAIIPSNTSSANQEVTQGMVDGLVVRFAREWEMLNEECYALCNAELIFESSCAVSEIMLLSDLRPLGQYGSIVESTSVTNSDNSITITPNPDFALSIFNGNATTTATSVASALFYDGTTANHNWKNPVSDYKYEDGSLAYVTIQKIDNAGTIEYSPLIDDPSQLISEIAPNGLIEYKIKPQYLTDYLDFKNEWDDNFSYSLLEYHPEYCYLQYEKEVCKYTKPITYIKENNDVVTLNLSSSEYDALLRKTSTFARASQLGLFQFTDDNRNSLSTKIFSNDPYFQQQFSNFETLALFDLRKGIMKEAIEMDYFQEGGTTLKLYEAALQMVLCNSISTCTINFNNPTIPQDKQDMVWNTYKALYLGLKAKVQHVFSNIYAIENNCYNGCIGDYSSINVTNVLTDNFSQKSALYSHINSQSLTNSLCNSTSATLYGEKDKRFIPEDFGYNSGIDSQTAVNQLVAQADYEHYIQTGDCPLLFDLELFLNNRFKTVNETNSLSLLGNQVFLDQYLSNDLLKALGTNITLPVQQLDLNTTTVSGKLNLAFSSNPIQTFNAIVINEISGYTWNTYGISWEIEDIVDYFYDAANSNLANKVFAFKAIAKIKTNTGQIVDALISGTTHAAIGECGVVDNGVGQVLDPNAGTDADGNGCTIRSEFTNAFVSFVNKLRTLGVVNNTTPYNLDGVEEYKNSYLADFFAEDISSTLTTTWIANTNNNFSIVRNGVVLINIVGATIPNLPTNGTNNQFNDALIIDSNGNQSIQLFSNGTSGSIVNSVYKIIDKLNFSCCDSSCKGDADCDGVPDDKDNCRYIYNPNQADADNDGIGDMCDEDYINIVNVCKTNVIAEQKYEKNLKNFLNSAILNNQIGSLKSVNLNSELLLFIQDSNLVSHFQTFKDFYYSNLNLNDPIYNDPIHNVNVSINDNFLVHRPVNANSDITYIKFYYSSTYYNFIELRGININFIDTINYIDIIDDTTSGDNSIISYVYQNQTYLKSIRLFNFTQVKSVDHQAFPSSRLCNFLNENYSISNPNQKSKTDNFTLFSDKNGNIVSSQTLQPCTTCIPPTVEPIPCNDVAKNKLINHFATYIPGYEFEQAFLDSFCNHNYQYIVDSYIDYLTAMNITATTQQGYLPIYTFGNTFLNYGYNDINNVINQYVAYFNLNNTTNPQELLSWNDWVDNDFRSANPVICPPARRTLYSPDLIEDEESACEQMLTNISETYQEEAYQSYIQTLRNKFIKEYIEQAMSNVTETFKMKYYDKEYQYTLYYYDQAGNLTQTVAPEGVKRFTITELNTKNNLINNYREAFDPLSVTPTPENPSLLPNHGFKTEYRYNSLNQLVWQNTPDGGETRFAYDDLGRIIASQNANQKTQIGFKLFSYTKYDELGRIIEAGQAKVSLNAAYSISDEGRLLINNIKVNQIGSNIEKTEVTRSIYDVNPEFESGVFSNTLFTTLSGTSINERLFNNRNRVTGVFYYDTYDHTRPFVYNNAIFYNYDVHGNVKEMVTYITHLRNLNCNPNIIVDTQTGRKNDCEQHLKRVVYDYDLISGNVNTVTFQPKKTDQFIHKYEYDADNRIVNVQTSPDGYIWEKDANYQYYAHGPLSRVEIGNKQVQGLDYAYTLQGWLKVVNGENLASPENDMGQDGFTNATTNNINIAKDAFGYSLNYFDGDYKAIDPTINDNGTTTALKPLMLSRNTLGATNKNLYNGNIKQMTTAIRKEGNTLLDVQKNNYSYDQLNRIKAMSSLAIVPSNNPTPISKVSYSSSYSYDRNGNLKDLRRTAFTPSSPNDPLLMDNFTYKYNTVAKNNQLTMLLDDAPDLFGDGKDIKKNWDGTPASTSYDVNSEATHNYIYDEIGQLTQDKSEKLKIDWRVDGKVSKVTKSTDPVHPEVIDFVYDGLGNRIAKKVSTPSLGNITEKITYYARDAQGNVLGVYEESKEPLNSTPTVDLYLNAYSPPYPGETRSATNAIYVSNDGNISSINNNVTVNLFAGNKIILKPGFRAVSGSDFLAKIKLVENENATIYTLAEHHIYGSSRLGVENKMIDIFKQQGPIALPKTSIIKGGKDFALSGKGVIESPVANSIIPVYRNYSLHFDSGTKATWLTNEILTDADLKNFTLSTKLKGNNFDVAANQNYSIGELIYKGRKTINSEFNETINSNACVSALFNSNNSSYTISRIPQAIQDPNQLSCFYGPDQPVEYELNTLPTASDSGYIEYKTSTSTLSKGVKVGFVDFNGMYGFRTNNGIIYRINGVTQTIFGPASFSPNSTVFKIVKTEQNEIKYYINGALIHTITNTNPLVSKIIFQTDRGEIKDFKAVRLTNEEVDITNKLEVSLTKDANGYKPRVDVTKYVDYTNSSIATTKSKASYIANNYVSTANMQTEGMQLDFNLSLDNTGSNNTMLVNGISTAFANPSSLVNDSNVGVVPTAINSLGNTLLSFDMCNFDYSISAANPANSIITNNFSFDDVTSLSQTDNQPQNQNQSVTMAVTPSVIRTLGPCLIDTDRDGIFDIYEDVNDDNNLANDDTDGDGRPDYDDNDDDGDGILSRHEFNDNNGNHHPDDAIDHDLDGIPDYRDVDDDGDGYATWETLEGGAGVLHNNPAGLPYTLNDDATTGDIIPNYLDPTNGKFQQDLEYAGTDSFLSLIGDKRYELSNHLGNVLVVINDKKIPSMKKVIIVGIKQLVLSHFNADILSYNDYYPFGQLLPGRHGNSKEYRYGFNGMEKDDELKGEGNSYTTEFRQYDPRVGRWLSLDPLMAKFPSSSPYLAFNNNPIFFIDPTGLQGEEPLTTERRESVLVERIYNRATKTKLNIITHIEVVEEHYIRIYESTNKQVVENVIEKEFKMTTIIVDDYGDELNGNSRMSTTYKSVSGTRKTSKRVKATGFISLFTDTVLKEVEKTVIDKKSTPTLGQGKGVDITFRMGQVKEAIGNVDEAFDGKLHLFGYLDKINSNTKNMDEIVLSQAFTRILNFYKVPAASTIVKKGLSLMLPEHTDYLQTGTYTLHNLRRTYPQSTYPHARTTDDLSSALNKGGVLYPFTNEGKKEVKE